MAIPHRPPDIADVAAAIHPRSYPNAPAHYYGQPPKRKPAAVPWWMLGPAALQKQAQEQANAYYKPQLDELHRQQLEAKNQAAANLRAVQKLIEVVSAAAGGLDDNVQAAYAHAAGADYGPSDFAGRTQDAYRQEGQAYSGLGDIYKAQAGLAGQAQFLNTVQDSDKIARDLLGEILKVQGEIPGTAQDIYKELVSGQDKYKSAQQKEYESAYKRAFDTAKYYTQNTGVLYIVADTPQGPQIVAAKDKKTGKDIRTDGMTPYQKAQLQARAQASKDRAAKEAADAAKPTYFTSGGRRYRLDPATGKATLVPGQQPIPKKTEKPPQKVILGKSGTPLTKGEIDTYVKDVYGIMGDIHTKSGKVVQRSLPAILNTLRESPVPEAIWKPIVAKRFGIPPWAVRGVKPSGPLTKLPFQKVFRIALFLGFDPETEPASDKTRLISWIVLRSGLK